MRKVIRIAALVAVAALPLITTQCAWLPADPIPDPEPYPDVGFSEHYDYMDAFSPYLDSWHIDGDYELYTDGMLCKGESWTTLTLPSWFHLVNYSVRIEAWTIAPWELGSPPTLNVQVLMDYTSDTEYLAFEVVSMNDTESRLQWRQLGNINPHTQAAFYDYSPGQNPAPDPIMDLELLVLATTNPADNTVRYTASYSTRFHVDPTFDRDDYTLTGSSDYTVHKNPGSDQEGVLVLRGRRDTVFHVVHVLPLHDD